MLTTGPRHLGPPSVAVGSRQTSGAPRPGADDWCFSATINRPFLAACGPLHLRGPSPWKLDIACHTGMRADAEGERAVFGVSSLDFVADPGGQLDHRLHFRRITFPGTFPMFSMSSTQPQGQRLRAPPPTHGQGRSGLRRRFSSTPRWGRGVMFLALGGTLHVPLPKHRSVRARPATSSLGHPYSRDRRRPSIPKGKFSRSCWPLPMATSGKDMAHLHAQSERRRRHPQWGVTLHGEGVRCCHGLVDACCGACHSQGRSWGCCLGLDRALRRTREGARCVQLALDGALHEPLPARQ